MRSPFFHILLIALGVGCLAVSMYDVKYIEGNSMSPTLFHDDTVIIYRWAYGIQPPLINRYILRWGKVTAGELVYFHDPVCMLPVVKRCAGTADTPVIVKKDGIAIGAEELANGELHNTYILRLNYIPEGKLFLLGDNRGISFDSRHYGFVDESIIEGRVVRFRKDE